jgi:hypothetical protein
LAICVLLRVDVTDELKARSNTSIAKITYGWDGNGNETSKTTTTAFAGAASNTYTYGLADRLTSRTTGSPPTQYSCHTSTTCFL